MATKLIFATFIFLVFSGGRARSSELATSPEAAETLELAKALNSSPLGWRSNHSAVVIGRRMIVWGGKSLKLKQYESGPTPEYIEGAMFDFDTRQWTVLPKSPLSRRYDHAAAVVGNKMLITGGVDEAGLARNPRAKGAAIFDLDKMAWYPINSIPDGGFSTETPYYGAGATRSVALALDEDNIFVCCINPGIGTYKISTDTWTEYYGVWERRNHSAVLHDEKVVMLSGEDREYRGPKYLEDAAFSFDPRKDFKGNLLPFPGSQWYSRVNHSAVVYQNKMIVFGGGRDVYAPFSDLGVFDFDSNQWEWKQPDVYGKSGHSAVVIDGKMILWGGLNAGWDFRSRNADRGNIPMILDLATMTWDSKGETSTVTAPEPACEGAPTGTYTENSTDSSVVVERDQFGDFAKFTVSGDTRCSIAGYICYQNGISVLDTASKLNRSSSRLSTNSDFNRPCVLKIKHNNKLLIVDEASIGCRSDCGHSENFTGHTFLNDM